MVSAPSTPVANQSRPLRGIGLKVLSVGMFLTMASLLKAAKGIPPGEMVFFRSLFALVPIMGFLVWRNELVTGTRTSRPWGHLARGGIGVIGQGLGFYALTQLPLAEVTAIQYTLPLLTVAAGALFLGENVRAYRWSAVILGMVGVAIIIGPRLTVFDSGAVGADGLHPGWGAISALVGCLFAAVAYVQVRRLVATERSSTIVLYYSLMCALLALLTLPFGWVLPDLLTVVMLVLAGIFGGLGQVTLTESFRQADMSVVAPFEYVSLIVALIVGYLAFGDLPTLPMLAGSAILIGAGVFVIYREHQLGVARARESATP